MRCPAGGQPSTGRAARLPKPKVKGRSSPWSPGTLRNLVGAVMLPIVLWLIQCGLQARLG